MEKYWKIREKADSELIDKLSGELNINPVLANLLLQRNISTFEEAKEFFRPSLEQMHDPFLMKDMDVAVERLVSAIANNESILVYGDYDVDGTTSVSLVYSFLKKYYNNIDYYIPDRYSEGYGISFSAIDYAALHKVNLIIALDCGIKAVEKIKYAAERNIDFIVCDHHTPGEILPKAVAVLDPKRADCSYPYKELSGCGVGFKFMQAYSMKKNLGLDSLLEHIDLVAVSIASDIVPITGENRILTHFGLKKLEENPGTGLHTIKRNRALKIRLLQ
jgi:single-stranded-DNA-specific exonuclease